MNLAIIPARGGSKRIPRKNIKLFCGKPMLAWSIEAARHAGCFDHIVVSTDDAEIAHVAQEYGAEVPFIRPAEISDDYTGTSAVVRHAIKTLAEAGQVFEHIGCVYATAPFLNGELLKEAFALLQKKSPSYVFSVTPYSTPIQRALRLNQQGQVQMRQPEFAAARSQDLEVSYHDAGQFYLAQTETWLAQKSVFNSGALPFILPNYRVQDIDTQDDWLRAELMMQGLQQMGAL